MQHFEKLNGILTIDCFTAEHMVYLIQHCAETYAFIDDVTSEIFVRYLMYCNKHRFCCVKRLEKLREESRKIEDLELPQVIHDKYSRELGFLFNVCQFFLKKQEVHIEVNQRSIDAIQRHADRFVENGN